MKKNIFIVITIGQRSTTFRKTSKVLNMASNSTILTIAKSARSNQPNIKHDRFMTFKIYNMQKFSICFYHDTFIPEANLRVCVAVENYLIYIKIV